MTLPEALTVVLIIGIVMQMHIFIQLHKLEKHRDELIEILAEKNELLEEVLQAFIKQKG